MRDISFDHFFTVMGNKQRVKILQLLNGHGSMSVTAITAELMGEQSAVSHSLRQLLACHFVSVERSGKERIYAINDDTVHPIFDLIEQHVKKYCARECEHS